MIFGNVSQLTDFSFLEERVLACFKYAQMHDLKALEPGTYEIDGDQLFVNIVEYTTRAAEECSWEAHRKYLDIHFMLNGEEQIDLCFIENMRQKEFEPDKDFLPMEGEPSAHVVLKQGDFLVCYPHDGHRPSIQTDVPRKIKKAIFKTAI